MENNLAYIVSKWENGSWDPFLFYTEEISAKQFAHEQNTKHLLKYLNNSNDQMLIDFAMKNCQKEDILDQYVKFMRDHLNCPDATLQRLYKVSEIRRASETTSSLGDTIGYLEHSDGIALLNAIAADHVTAIVKNGFEPYAEALVLDPSKDGNKPDVTQFAKFIKKNPEKFYMCKMPPSVESQLLKYETHISKQYKIFIGSESLHDKNNLFLDIYQEWVDLVSLLIDQQQQETFDITGLNFLLNIIMQSDFFNFLKVDDNNPTIKILRNIRKYNNIIRDQDTLSSKYKHISHFLQYYKSGKELAQLSDNIIAGEQKILFDKNEMNNVNALLVVNSRYFLKCIVTFVHIVIFCCGLSENLVISRQLFKDYCKVTCSTHTHFFNKKVLPKNTLF